MLETARLRLRRFTEADVDNLVALDGDPSVMRYLADGRPTPRETIEREVLPGFLAYDRHPDLGVWAAHERATDRFVGWFALTPPDPADPTNVELGYRLMASAWGHGYATEGARFLVDRAFSDLGVRRVFATTMTVNTRSRRVMENVGLAYVRTFFEEWPEYLEGSEHGDVEYALTRERWRVETGPAAPTRG